MNLPNKLTLGRMLMIILFIIIYVLKDIIGSPYVYILGAIFVIASLTDFFDGYLARKHNLVTTFGKFVDPLADKLLVITALFVLSDMYALNGFTMTYWMPFWVVLIVVIRELLVTSIRLVAMEDGTVLAASQLGKYKTFFTMATITYYFFIMPIDTQVIQIIGIIFVGISVLLTLISMIDYFIKNYKIITKSI
ncbi:CDP-diacylglycerol--glycerol-3-phosphate 3-phosphatidyltransferase [Hujiaoplasma nucleasis]|uniref:CDP-diacylglycerol--glycerol-3-phosphate 3-phosphatidyltransferase n=1 Tax=Hujiaoplasma nucleasis TaxID=2725268 RepID=A0A7L6N3E9_9MOLU|nr:CDP-diacylglycerol--glycerol-3-phosphate 3-phosphatidyltransferase [Hujiaoplasma nucleasis]QLY39767.1 CDP-diacylglycerol--glycerol-3-phosphate 3-phosphatidyltransferase [Hujiaoplasma nucleasis]